MGSPRDIVPAENLRSNGPSNQISTKALSNPSGVPVPDHFLVQKGYPSTPPDVDADFVSRNDTSQRLILSPEQTKVLQMVQQGRNVFFTGSAGMLLAVTEVDRI